MQHFGDRIEFIRDYLRTAVAHLTSEHVDLASQLKRIYERPWRPIKFTFN